LYALHLTGCRSTGALELTGERIFLKEQEIVLKTIKKRKFDNEGSLKKPKHRHIPVPEFVIDDLDLIFHLRKRLKKQTENQKFL
jgi:integrase